MFKRGQDRGIRQSTMNFGILGIFFLIVLLLIGDEIFMTRSIRTEQTAETRRAEFKQLGEDLANASDYLTDEAREFAITGSTEHMYNYWKEIDVTRTRDNVIEQLKKNDPSPAEQAFLANAKRHSDDLTETERHSMRLVLESKGFTQSSITQKEVSQYRLTAGDEALSPSEKLEKARSIMFDSAYQEAKNNIMSPIEQFKTVMNERLDKEMKAAQKNTEQAAAAQMALSVFVIIAIGAILRLFFRQVTKPIENYALSLREMNGGTGGVRLSPRGTQEIRMLAHNFNRLYDSIQSEISRRRQAEQTMREAKEEAERANGAKSEFLASMSHEIRTPINAITGYGYLLKSGGLSKKQAEYVDRLNLSAKNLLSIVNDILDFTKIEAGKLTLEEIPFDLTGAARDCCAMLEAEALRKGLYLRLEIGDGVPRFVLGDSTRLRQVLLNLLGNAVKFTLRGGVTLKIETCAQEETARGGGKPEALLRLSVTDTGIGISDAQKDRLFDVFTQGDASTSRKFGGTGLGLAISRQIVELMGGTIGLESTPGEGSTFYFDIRVRQTDAAPQAETHIDRRTVRAHLQGRRALLVEDNDINREMTREILSNIGMLVDAASGGEEAVQKALANTYDIIFMDIRMPVVDGYEATRRIRAAEKTAGRAKTLIAALSADAVEGVKEKALRAGMDLSLTKPLDPDKIFGAVFSYFPDALYEAAADDCSEKGNHQGGALPDSEILDTKTALKRLGGSSDTYRRILSKFAADHRQTPEALAVFAGRGDLTRARQIAHDLKGIGDYLGAGELTKEAKALIGAIDAGGEAVCGPLCEVLAQTVRECGRICAAMANAAPPKPTEGTPPEFQAAKLARLFEDGEVEAQILYRRSRDAVAARFGEAAVLPLDDAVDSFRFEEAAKILKNLYEEREESQHV